MYKILKRYTTTVFKQALRDTFYDELKFFAQECYYKNMTGQSTVEANTTNEELLFGFTEALQALETTLNEKLGQLTEEQARRDILDFLREVELLTREDAVVRFLPGNNNAEVIFQGTGGVHNSLNVVAQKPFSVAENSLYDVTVIKSSSAGTETFELVVSGDSIVLDRSRVDNAAIEGGTWTRRSEI